MKKMRCLLFLLFTSFLLLYTFKTNEAQTDYQFKFESPEGIVFLSYSKNWDQKKLEELYQELVKNRHGEELYALREIRVQDGGEQSRGGQYNFAEKSITLLHAERYKDIESMRHTLSHEYGHHFSDYYFPFYLLSFSKWAKLRGISDDPRIYWYSFWNYSIDNHKWFPQEIIADDYLLLYGSTKPSNVDFLFKKDGFLTTVKHENQDIKNVMEEKQLLQYLEEVTGLKVDSDRLFSRPKLLEVKDNQIIFSISNKPTLAYRLSSVLYFKLLTKCVPVVIKDSDIELNPNKKETIAFSLDELVKRQYYPTEAYLKVKLEVVDVLTNISLETENIYLKRKETGFFTIISDLEVNQLHQQLVSKEAIQFKLN